MVKIVYFLFEHHVTGYQEKIWIRQNWIGARLIGIDKNWLSLTSKGCLIKKFPNVLLNNAKMVDSTVKPQAKGQNNFSIALKWGIVCLCNLNSIGDMIESRKYHFFEILHFLRFFIVI